MIKMGVDPDNKSRYIKLAKNTIIASVLITLSLTLLEIPKDYFGSPIGIADETTSDITFAKIEDKDCQGREVVNIDGKRYVVTDTGMKLGALTDNDSLDNVTTMGFYDTGKVVENVSFLRLFSECQGTFKGYFADISYYRDAEGFIFPTYFTYPQYTAYKGAGGDFTSNGRKRSEEVAMQVADKKTINIPAQIKLKTEFFEGYGIEELVKTIIVFAVASVIGYIIYLFTKVTLYSTFFVIRSVVMAVVFFTKNRNNFSMADGIKNLIKYELMQKRYKYERGNFNKSENKNIK